MLVTYDYSLLNEYNTDTKLEGKMPESSPLPLSSFLPCLSFCYSLFILSSFLSLLLMCHARVLSCQCPALFLTHVVVFSELVGKG